MLCDGAKHIRQRHLRVTHAEEDKPKTTDGAKHPEEWRRGLNPDRMAGQNIGGAAEAHERMTRTAYGAKRIHRALDEFTDDELKQIPILDSGTRLPQGATYLDLVRAEFTATGEMAVAPGQTLVPKDGVHYEMWNRLVRQEKS
jgi:hypothetical protein